MRKRHVIVAVALCIAALGLSGCGEEPVDETLTVDEAKAIAQAGELDIVAQIPAELVVDVAQQPLGALLSCEGDRNYTWAGGTVVTVTADADVTEVIDGLRETFAERDGWNAEAETSSFGDPLVRILGPNGDHYLAGGIAEDSVIDIDSYSPCFHLRDDQSPHDDY